ncbi:MAG: pyridoxamine 5'-phosphate oxidase family protein [Deltaproteobacteria bacterium]|nr:pyridoxamine 5'-phosphate oxidase family protein [Deltaproteobacteria bacterium]
MHQETLSKAVELANRLGHVFVATADAEGLPHVAAAGSLELISPDQVSVSSWFCPTTTDNIERNPRIALVIWDRENDVGYQLLGKTSLPRDTAIMDGFSPELEQKGAIPQVEWRLLVHVNNIIAFSHAPHSDKEE